MTQYELLLQEDLELKKIKEEKEKRLFEKKVIDDVQLRNLKMGKPIPVLSPLTQTQNTSKEAQKLREQQRKESLRIENELESRRQKRISEIQKNNQKEYQEYIEIGLKQRFKENQHLHDKDHER